VKYGYGLCFNRGEAVLGATSPLWVFLIALFGIVTRNLLAVSKVLGFVFSLGSILIFSRLASLSLKRKEFVIASVFAVAFDAWLVRWSLSGMETPLVVFVVLLSIFFHEREKLKGTSFGASPLFSALSALARPEGALLAVLMLADRLMWKGRRLRSFLFSLFLNLIVLAPWLIYAERTFGTVIPTTALVKAGRFAQSAAELSGAAIRSVKIILASQGPEAVAIALLVVIALFSGGLKRLPRLLHERFVPVLWLICLPSFYVLRGVEVLSRYLAPVLPVMTLLGFLSLESIYASLRTRAGKASTWAALLAVFAVSANLYVLRFEAYPHTKSFSRGMNESLIPMGKWLKSNSAPDATVAVTDVGAIGYYSDRKILDLGALISPQLIGLLREREFDVEKVASDLSFRRYEKTNYLVDRSPIRERLMNEERLPASLRPIMTGSISGLGITNPVPVFYTLYSIDWKEPRGE
jgi:arabinofuranosyltransferase